MNSIYTIKISDLYNYTNNKELKAITLRGSIK